MLGNMDVALRQRVFRQAVIRASREELVVFDNDRVGDGKGRAFHIGFEIGIFGSWVFGRGFGAKRDRDG